MSELQPTAFSRAVVVALIVSASITAFQPAMAQPTLEDMQREIEKRDAVIDRLLRRMDSLEKEVRARPSVTPAPARETREVAPVFRSQPGVAQVPPAVVPPPSTGPIATTVPAESEEEAMISRALENTLVNQGGQLLPPYMYQIVPDFSYSHQSLDQIAFVTNGSIVRQRSHVDRLEWGLGFRIGLPWEFTGQHPGAGWPCLWLGNFRRNDDNQHGSWRLWRHINELPKAGPARKGTAPDVLLNVTYKAGPGSTSLTQQAASTFPTTVGTGSGFNALSGGVTVLKRQDPLVFLGAFEYPHSFPSNINGVRQTLGDQYGFRVEAILAASPDTSLRIGFLDTFQQPNSFGGGALIGSGQQFSSLELGVGSVISPKVYLDAALLVGLTRDTPDFTLLLSMPFRF